MGPQNHGKYFTTMALFVGALKNEQGIFRQVVSHKAFGEDKPVSVWLDLSLRI